MPPSVPHKSHLQDDVYQEAMEASFPEHNPSLTSKSSEPHSYLYVPHDHISGVLVVHLVNVFDAVHKPTGMKRSRFSYVANEVVGFALDV